MRYLQTAILFCCLTPLISKAQTVKEYYMETLFQLDEVDIPLYKPDVKYKQVSVSAYYYTSNGSVRQDVSLTTKFDSEGRFTSVNSPGSPSTFSYFNNTVTVDNGGSRQNEFYELDAKGRILMKSLMPGMGVKVLDRHVRYTSNGRISYLHKTNGSIADKKIYQLGETGKVKHYEEYHSDTTAVYKTVDYTYNQKGQLVSSITKFKGSVRPGGVPYTYTYNDRGLIASLKKGDGEGAALFTFNYVYDAKGEWTKMECQFGGDRRYYVNRSYIR